MSSEYSKDPFLGWFERLIGQPNDAAAITALFFIFLGLALILCLTLTVYCWIRAKRKKAKKQKKATMKTLMRHQLPGAMASTDNAQIHIALQYEQRKEQLKVSVAKAQGLKPVEGSSGVDPYVKLHLEEIPVSSTLLLPTEKRKKHSKEGKTHHIQNTLDPVWNSEFDFKLLASHIPSTILKLEVFDNDETSLDMKLGETECRLGDLTQSDFLDRFLELRLPLMPGITEYTGYGQLYITLQYQPHEKMIHVHILEAKNLTFSKHKKASYMDEKYPDMTVTATLYQSGKEKNTHTTRRCHTPYFNAKMNFPVSPSKIQSYSMTVKLSYAFVAKIMKSRGYIHFNHIDPEKRAAVSDRHWSDMLATPGQAVSRVHPLVNSKNEAYKE